MKKAGQANEEETADAAADDLFFPSWDVKVFPKRYSGTHTHYATGNEFFICGPIYVAVFNRPTLRGVDYRYGFPVSTATESAQRLLAIIALRLFAEQMIAIAGFSIPRPAPVLRRANWLGLQYDDH